MVNVNDVYKLSSRVIANKNQTGLWTVDSANLAFKAVNISWLNDNIGQPNQEQNGKKGNDSFYEANKRITDNLRFLIVKKNLPIKSDGTVIIPEDYYYVSSARVRLSEKKSDGTYIPKEARVKLVDEGQLSYFLSSDLLYPIKEEGIMCFVNGNLETYPYTSGQLIFSYVKMPQTPVWGYTPLISPTDRPVYDPSLSTDFDYPADNLVEITVRVCQFLGINVLSQFVLGFAKDLKTTGT